MVKMVNTEIQRLGVSPRSKDEDSVLLCYPVSLC
jgi:hypothetical protein